MHWLKGCTDLWLECDSMFLLRLFTKQSTYVQWEIRQESLTCLQNLDGVREGDEIVDALAGYGRDDVHPCWWGY